MIANVLVEEDLAARMAGARFELRTTNTNLTLEAVKATHRDLPQLVEQDAASRVTRVSGELWDELVPVRSSGRQPKRQVQINPTRQQLRVIDRLVEECGATDRASMLTIALSAHLDALELAAPANSLTQQAETAPEEPQTEPPAPHQKRRFETLRRYEGRLWPDQLRDLTALRLDLQEARTDHGDRERLTNNTLIRIGVAALLDHKDALAGNTEEELLEALRRHLCSSGHERADISQGRSR